VTGVQTCALPILDPCEQLIFLQALSEKKHIPLRLGTFQEHITAISSKDSLYSEVLRMYSFYVSELVQFYGKESFVRRLIGGELTKEIFFDNLFCNGSRVYPIKHPYTYRMPTERERQRIGRRYHVSDVLQSEIFTDSGNFGPVKGVLPTDSDFVDDGITGSAWRLPYPERRTPERLYAMVVHKVGYSNDNGLNSNRLILDGVILPLIPDVTGMDISICPWTDGNPRR